MKRFQLIKLPISRVTLRALVQRFSMGVVSYQCYTLIIFKRGVLFPRAPDFSGNRGKIECEKILSKKRDLSFSFVKAKALISHQQLIENGEVVTNFVHFLIITKFILPL